MPVLKSPGKVLKLWKKATADYLKASKAKELEPQEDFLNKKVIKGLDRLRVAANNKAQTAATDFNAMRDETNVQMDKFRKLFKPKKSQPTVKKFYQNVCRMTVVVEELALNDLDANDADVGENVLDDVD